MGSSQVGYIWIQNIEYQPDKIRLIIDSTVDMFINLLERAWDKWKTPGVYPTISDIEKEFPALMTLIDFGRDSPIDDIDEWRLKLRNDDFVTDLVEFLCDPGEARDTATRGCPFDEKLIICYAGTETWGDEPDGFGYECMKVIEKLGLEEALEIQ